MRLTRKQRNGLVREGFKLQRKYGTIEEFEIADHLFGIVTSDEQAYGTEGVEAIEISDYCYGIARFVTGGRY
jgi:hypothetical protein